MSRQKKQTTDEKVLLLIAAVRKQKKEIAEAERPLWRTNCTFYLEEGGAKSVSLRVEANPANLVKLAAFVRLQEEYYTKTAKLFQLDVPPFSWCGFSVEDWLHDFKTRINGLLIQQKKKKLEELEARLDALVSPEMRTSLELQSIEAELGNV